jgi:tetratricopeptide (TPR) repeat protein
MPRRAAAVVLLLLFSRLFSAAPGAGQKAQPKAAPLPSIAPLDLARLLDLYAGGRFDEAVRSVAQAGDETGRHLRRHWDVSGRQWIDADPAQRPQRILAAVAFALETEHVRAERGDWRVTDDPPCPASCVLDWAQLRLIERGSPDQAERAWLLAAAALTGGVQDWRYLQRPVDPRRSTRVLPGLMDRALLRFPGDPSLRLEQALAAAGRFNITVDGRRLAPTVMALPPAFGGRGFSVVPIRLDGQEAAGLLTALVDDPQVGAEARMRLGFLYWAFGRDEAARDALTKAAAQAGDADLRYLAQFLLGWIAIARGDSAAAIPPLEAALAARPGSQSAALALASLELQRGDAGKAHDLARASLDERRADVDPWRLFLYGHHPQWPARVAELRRAVKP